ncbi:MAG TPA: hypothetical protein VGJ18_13250 [Gemmatimonadaceae bacterium]
MLDARLARGWVPTPSALKTGDAILGYASCAVTGTRHRPSGPARRPNV